MDTCYVALDLELLDSAEHGREILEIGAVLFRGDQELTTFSTLVQTRAPLSHRVSRLTGLAEHDLSAAVPLRQALLELGRLVGTHPVVGQSIDLDAEQLRRAGFVIPGPLLDTFELAALLRPGLASYDLDSIARTLEVNVPRERHRALADARLAMRVFNRLLECLHELDLDTLAQVNRLSLSLNWPLRLLFAQAERRGRQLHADLARSDRDPLTPAWLKAAEAPRGRDSLTPNERRVSLDLEQLTSALSTGGAVAERLDGFEERPEQLAMVRAVAEAFNRSEHLLVEAGTGTGKSLAYLLPAVHFAVANNRRVVISTNTINLQDQLSQKELPSLRRATGLPFKFRVLKGRANYLCLRRWLSLLRSDELAPEERTLLIKTLLWLPHTDTGDRAELRLAGREEDAWLKVCALADGCTPQHCVFHRGGRCFLARARRAAEASHIVVVNHSLLLADLATRSRVIPEYRHLIVDEAHHLEDEATAQLGWRVGQRELTSGLDRLWETGGLRQSGLVPQALGLLRRRAASPEAASLDRLQDDLVSVVPTLAAELPSFFASLKRAVVRMGERGEGGATMLRVTGAVRAQPDWSNLETAWDQQNQRVLRLVRTLGELLLLLEAVNDEGEEWEDLSGELAVQVSLWETLRERLWSSLIEQDRDAVVWITIGRNDEVYVNSAPLHVGDHLRETLFRDKDCVVLTSATLTAEGSFRYIAERLGLDDAAEVILGSPFDYREAALVYLPTDLPEPNSAGYQAAVERVVGQLIAALDGRTLVLFTSYSQLRATYYALREPLEARQITLLGQRMDGASRARLLESFKGGDRVALMGTTSFWEGVDVVGEALSCLVMARLPFATPSDPVFQARSEAFEEPFTQYAVPQAILRFRQGFGRLIRSRSDRGIMVVLDSRIWKRQYGRAFLRSLPGCEVREGPSRQAASAARDWLGM